MSHADGHTSSDRDSIGATSRIEEIGPYRIVRVLGEGGMGRVYLATQVHPRRKVALKIVAGLSRQSNERLRREIEVLAQLEHPGIARLYAAGEARIGLIDAPWLAMEYIEGTDLVTYADTQRLSLAARIELLIAVASAVEFAHARGIVHRDLKPANILVDASGQPKILDFGIARLRDRADASLTEAGQILGTLPYMSPEQLRGEGAHVDLRSDIYSLGAIAYELIGGRLPHPALAVATLIEANEIVRRTAPLPLARLRAAARGDMETVIMQALAADPAQRPATAAAFAHDLRRVLEHRPISARAPTRLYRSVRFVRRHRALCAASAIVFAILIAASIVSLRFALGEQHARAEAEHRAQESTAANQFLENMLASADPERARGRVPTLGEVVERAEHELDSLAGQPNVERTVASTLAATRSALGDYPAALALNARALALAVAQPPAPPEQRAALLRQKAGLLTELGRFDDARVAIADARAAWPEAPLPVRLGIDLAATRIEDESGHHQDAERGYRAIIEAGEHASARTAQIDTSLDVARSDLSSILRDKGELAEAEALIRKVLTSRSAALGERSPATLASRHKLSVILAARGDNVVAESEGRAVLALQREVLGDAHASTLTTMHSLANVLATTARVDEAEALARESLQGLESLLGESHAQTLSVMNTLAYLLEERKQYAEAEARYRRILSIEERTNNEHASTLAPRNNLAMLLMNTGKLDAANAQFEILVARARATVGAEHAMTAIFMSNEGLCLSRMGRAADARALLEPAHARLIALMGIDHARTRAAAERLAAVYAALGMRREASTLQAESGA